MTPLELFFNILGPLLGWCTLSYTWGGDSYAFVIAENILIGGIYAQALFTNFSSIQSQAFNPLLGGKLLAIVPLIIGFLAFTRLTRFRWMARFPVSVLSGVGVGLVSGTILRSQILNAITQQLTDLTTLGPISGTIGLIASLTTMTYFLYSVKYSSVFHDRKGKLHLSVTLGRLFMMAAFGYLFSMFVVANAIDTVISFYQLTLINVQDAIMTGISAIPK